MILESDRMSGCILSLNLCTILYMNSYARLRVTTCRYHRVIHLRVGPPAVTSLAVPWREYSSLKPHARPYTSVDTTQIA